MKYSQTVMLLQEEKKRKENKAENLANPMDMKEFKNTSTLLGS